MVFFDEENLIHLFLLSNREIATIPLLSNSSCDFSGGGNKKLWNCSTYFVTRKQSCVMEFCFVLFFLIMHILYVFYLVFSGSQFSLLSSMICMTYNLWTLSYLTFYPALLLWYVLVCEQRQIKKERRGRVVELSSAQCTSCTKTKMKWAIFCSFKMVFWISYAKKHFVTLQILMYLINATCRLSAVYTEYLN